MATYSSWIENIVLWRNFLRNHLRPFLRFYGAYFFSESANSILKILTDCSFLRNDFENQFLRNYSIATTKNFFTILHSQFNYHTLPVTPLMQQYFHTIQIYEQSLLGLDLVKWFILTEQSSLESGITEYTWNSGSRHFVLIFHQLHLFTFYTVFLLFYNFSLLFPIFHPPIQGYPQKMGLEKAVRNIPATLNCVFLCQIIK